MSAVSQDLNGLIRSSDVYREKITQSAVFNAFISHVYYLLLQEFSRRVSIKLSKKDTGLSYSLLLINGIILQQLDTKLGAGGFGKVKLARDFTGDVYALKVEKSTCRTFEIYREKNKSGLVAQISAGQLLGLTSRECPTKSPEYDIKVYKLMPLIGGQQLRKLLTAGVDQINRYKLIISVLTALETMHAQDIIHCDVKPENVHIESGSDSYKATFLDFDFAHKLKSAAQIIAIPRQYGTQNYMAPEIMTARDSLYRYSKASDVYAMGRLIVLDIYCSDSKDMHQSDFYNEKDFLKRMSHANPNLRPTIAKVVQFYTGLLALIEAKNKAEPAKAACY